jgi:hypothetical protein
MSLPLKQEHGWRVFENRARRIRIFGLRERKR